MPPKRVTAEQVLASVVSDDEEDLDYSDYGNESDFESESSCGSESDASDNNMNNAILVPTAVSGGVVGMPIFQACGYVRGHGIAHVHGPREYH